MKGKPGKIAIWQYPGVETPLASRSSFRAQARVANLLISGEETRGFDRFKRDYSKTWRMCVFLISYAEAFVLLSSIAIVTATC